MDAAGLLTRRPFGCVGASSKVSSVAESSTKAWAVLLEAAMAVAPVLRWVLGGPLLPLVPLIRGLAAVTGRERQTGATPPSSDESSISITCWVALPARALLRAAAMLALLAADGGIAK